MKNKLIEEKNYEEIIKRIIYKKIERYVKIKGPILRLTPLLTNPLNSGTKLQF